MSVTRVELKRMDPATRKRVVRWKVRVQLPLDPATGKRPSIVRMCNTEREAKALERKLRHEADTGDIVAPGSATVEDVLRRWLRSRAGSVRGNTLHGYEDHIENYLVPALGHHKVQRLTVDDVQAAMDSWHTQGHSARLRRMCLQRLRAALSMAVAQRLANVNVADAVAMPPYRRKRVVVYTRDEARRFLSQAMEMPEKHRGGFTGRVRPCSLWPLWPLLLLEGMRRSEALGLRWSDVDLDNRTARISQTVVVDQGNNGAALVQSLTKTSSSARTVSLTQYTVDALKNIERRGDLIVCTAAGTVVNPSNVTRSFRRIVAAAGLRDDVTVHGLRHTCASLLLLAGVNPKVVAEKLGHGSVNITLDIYSHVMPSSHDAAAAAMDGLLNE